jgi:peptidoglycan/xylan/chitin deacetylase (PgdA/CDA1 family)
MSSSPGFFVLSFDFELVWGTLDLHGPDRFRRRYEIERFLVIDRLLRLIEEFQVPATWFVIGHLLLDRCGERAGAKHPEIVRPHHGWARGDWFDHDPGGTEEMSPLFFGRSLVEKIRACHTPQEIGCHSFSHIIFGDPGCSREAAASDLAACVRVAARLGLELRSFAFPRNRVGHLDLLASNGFRCYRGPDARWYAGPVWPVWVKRLAHTLEEAGSLTPPTVWPEASPHGLWNVPGSMIYLSMHGVRRHIPVSLRVSRALRGLESAVRRQRLFHLWMHPTNLVDGIDEMFDGLRRILAHASRLREHGQLRFLTVGQAAEVASAGG